MPGLCGLFVLIAMATMLTACGRDGGDSASADATDWERVVPGGDCRCSDGSEFSFWVRAADPKKVVLYLQDGGACFSAKTCAPERGLYNARVDEGPLAQGGMFDFADKRNPFADYSFVYVPYCTADVHLGNAATEYGAGLTVQHRGYVNGSAALRRLAASFPDATDVVVVGESAGSVAAPFYAGLASDRLPDARITALAHGSGSYPDAPAVNRLLSEAWGFGKGKSFPGLFIDGGRHDPTIVFARVDHAYDETQAQWYPNLGIPAGDLPSRIDANEARIEHAGINLLSYVAAGREHVILSDNSFYTREVNGERLVDWVAGLIQGKAVEDVHCRRCRDG
jgi:Pectinacetylesterase